MAKIPKEAPKKKSAGEKKAEAVKAVQDRANEESFEFFHDRFKTAYATVPVPDTGATTSHCETWRIVGEDYFRLWVMKYFHAQYGTAPRSWVKDAIEVFEMHAECDGPELNVYVRLGEQNGNLYLDLCRPRWEVVEIRRDGWRVVENPPVKFRRTTAMTALPNPQNGGRIQDLRPFLNCSRRDEILILTWLTFTLHRNAPYPILVLSGAQGSGKTCVTRALRALVDPSEAALSSPARNARDLAILAPQAHILTMDNVSDISHTLSDMLCRVSSGGSHKERRYYTNTGEQSIFTFRQPMILNGIGIESLNLRADLLDRMILLHYDPMPDSERRDETSLWERFEKVRPTILGALLDVVCAGLRNIDNVNLDAPPRMADFARWGCAVEEALGFKAGDFIAAYRAHLQTINDIALESSPIAWLLDAFLRQRPKNEFQGTAVQLLQHLHAFAGNESSHQHLVIKNPSFPKSANALSGEISRVVPNLAKLGIAVVRGRTHRGRFLHLTIDTTVTSSRKSRSAGA